LLENTHGDIIILKQVMDNITVSGYSVKLTNKPFSFTIAISLYFQAI